jgi:hypothetical protein
MKILKLYILFFVFLLTSASCTKDFEEINTDPNRPKEVYPGSILGQLQYKFVSTTISGAREFTHELMQVTAPRQSPVNGTHRYAVTPNSGTSLWNNIYSYMTDVEDLIAISEKLNEPNYKAIALIYRAWGFSILTDVFRDIPYLEAMKAGEGVYKPRFDDQKTIYTNILQDLEAANDLLDESKALTFGGDLVYNSTAVTNGKSSGISNWKKFANSLRLRLLLRILKRDGEVNVSQQINSILADPAKYPVFTANNEEAILRFPGSFPYFNPYYNARTLDWREGTYYTKYFINQLNEVEDPRRAVWATQVKVGDKNVYQGIESGYTSEVIYVVNRNSSYTDALKTLPQLGVMMTYAEVEFIKAELALKGFATGKTSRAHYESGITASMVQWGATMPAGFLEKEGVVYKAEASAEDQLKQIMLQKYFALYFNDYQAWFEKRRTGLPELPRGNGIPQENQFPSRIPYPTYLQSLNNDNLQAAKQAIGGDGTTIKAWWEE